MIQLYLYAAPAYTSSKYPYFFFDTSTNCRCTYGPDLSVAIQRPLNQPFSKSDTFDPTYASLLASGTTLQDCINAIPELFI